MFPRIHSQNTLPSTLQRGHKAKHEKAKAKIARNKDPIVLAIRSVRAGLTSLNAAESDARAEWEAAQAPVPSGIPLAVHPAVKALLDRFLEEHGLLDRDLSKPLDESDLSVLVEHRIAECKAQNAEAAERLARLQRDHAEQAVAVAQAHLATVEERQAAQGLSALSGAMAVEEPATIPVEDAPRRRGRPPKVLLDPDAAVMPD